jgi:hypothetical protein
MLLVGRHAPPLHSGRQVGAPVASLRCRTLRLGEVSISPPRYVAQKCLSGSPVPSYKGCCSGSAFRWPVLKCPRLAGFQMSTEAYFQRWDIEVNFRDEKTLLGVGQAHVRNTVSVESAPAFAVAAYGMLLVSGQLAFGNSDCGLIPQPKWAASSKGPRTSTQQLIHQLRAEVWGRGLGIDNFSGFASNVPTAAKPEKCAFPLASAVYYANG